MDQSKTGRFIAEMRRTRNLTQRQLAERLAISDKTVSKWECGKGLPEVSLMLPLCEILQITVNDLLSGERVADGDYQKKAEENMMDLIRENAENRERMTLSIRLRGLRRHCGLRAGFYRFLSGTAGGGACSAAALCPVHGRFGHRGRRTAGSQGRYYECPHCGALFVPTMADYVKGLHTLTRRRLTCPACGKTSMCRHRVTR